MQAIADAGRAIELDPELTLAYLGRAAVHDGLGNPDAALSDLEIAASLTNDHRLRLQIEAQITSVRTSG